MPVSQTEPSATPVDASTSPTVLNPAETCTVRRAPNHWTTTPDIGSASSEPIAASRSSTPISLGLKSRASRTAGSRAAQPEKLNPLRKKVMNTATEAVRASPVGVAQIPRRRVPLRSSVTAPISAGPGGDRFRDGVAGAVGPRGGHDGVTQVRAPDRHDGVVLTDCGRHGVPTPDVAREQDADNEPACDEEQRAPDADCLGCESDQRRGGDGRDGGEGRDDRDPTRHPQPVARDPVSYTHLTLPTKRI